MKQTLLLLGLIFGLMLGFSTADAAVDMFLKVESINGESTDPNHKDWIDLLSWRWDGVKNIPQTKTGGGSAKSMAEFFDVVVIKEADKSSPNLFLAVARGDNIPKVMIDITQDTSGVKQQSFINYELSDVFVSRYLISGTASENIPVEEISMNFNKVKMIFNQLDSTGKSKGQSTITWDLVTNEGGESTPVSVQILIDEVDEFVESGALNARTAASLKWLLGAAILSEQNGDDDTSVAKLESFSSRVNLFMARGMVSADVANQLMDSADVIIKGKKILEN